MERCTRVRARRTLIRTQPYWRVALFLAASFPGCGGLVGSAPPQPPPTDIAVQVSPGTASVFLGEPQQFTGAVTSAENPGVSAAVNWSVNGIPGGSAAAGTINSSGLYTAPAILPAPASVSVTATSAADASKSSSATVTIASDITVSLVPQNVSLELGASRLMAASVNSSGNPNRAVTWAATGAGCTGSACGTVDASGNYTAPQTLPSPPQLSLTATSAADPAKSSTAAITITGSFGLAVNGPASVTAGTSAVYTATLTLPLNSNPNRAISWSVSGAGCAHGSCGTISPGGEFSAPAILPAPALVQITATPLADPAKAASLPVSIASAIRVGVSPSSATLALGATQTFQATVTGAVDNTVTWDVNGIVGGNAAVGTIQNSQTDPDATTYVAPQAIPANGSITIRARSNADPGVSASASINFTGAVSVTLAPANVTLSLEETQTLVARVNNAANQNVMYLVNGVPGGNSLLGEICATGVTPCRNVSSSNGGSVDFVAPGDVPSPNPVTVTAVSQLPGAPSASALVTVLPHVVVSVQPGNASVASGGQLRLTAAVSGTMNQQVIWNVSGTGCGNPSDCGTIDSTGLYTAPPAIPSPNLIRVVATSLEDTSQTGAATVTITGGPAIFSMSPTSAYAGSSGGFTLLVTGSNFVPSNPGPGSSLLVGGAARATSCVLATQCIAALAASDLSIAGNLSVQVQNPDGSLSNQENFVVLATGSAIATIPLTPSAPNSFGNDIVVVELSTNGGSGAAGNVSLTVGAIGPYSFVNFSCVLGGTPVVVQRPARGTGTADLCLFSVSALSPLFQYTVSGPRTPDIVVSNREPLGLGLLHLTLQIPATAVPGARTLFVQNPEGDMAAGTGVIEVQ